MSMINCNDNLRRALIRRAIKQAIADNISYVFYNIIRGDNWITLSQEEYNNVIKNGYTVNKASRCQ